MRDRATIKIGAAIEAKLWKEFVALAKRAGQSQRSLIENAIAHYLPRTYHHAKLFVLK
jgi:hypothetical protein